jgi:tetratricopeptide (TPR) repeat protein
MASYDAFISYSHSKDKPVAAALQSVLQRLGTPWYRRRALRIFRDDTSLSATPELWPSIEQALANSRYFIALASPQFAESIWCTKEVAYWLQNKSISTMLIVVTDGDLAWDSASSNFVWSDATPLPASLKGQFRSEPKWIDFRPHRAAPNARDPQLVERGADLAAAIHGIPKDDLLSQEVLQQRRALRLAWSAATFLLLLAGFAVWQWRDATLARRIAETERDRAGRNYAIAQQASEEVAFKLVEDVSRVPGGDPSVINAILETARSMMDQLAKADTDNVFLQRSRAGLFSQFTNVYLRVGDLEKARTAADESLSIISRLVKVRPSNEVWRGDEAISWEKVGDVRLASGDRDGARAAFDESLVIRRRLVADYPNSSWFKRDVAASLRILGQLHREAGDRERAGVAFEESLTITRVIAAAEPDNLNWQSAFGESLLAVAAMRSEGGDITGAVATLTESLAVFRRLTAANADNPVWRFSLALNLERLGNLGLKTSDTPAALNAFEESLDIRRKLLAGDPRSTELRVAMAASLYNLSLVVPAARARPLLEEAVQIVQGLAQNNQLGDGTRHWPKLFSERLAALSASEQATPKSAPSSAPNP